MDVLDRRRGLALRYLILAAVPNAMALGCSAVDDARTGGAAAETGGADDGEAAASPAQFGPAQHFELRLNDPGTARLALSMSRDEVAELFGDAADDVLLLELDTTPLLTNVLEAIRNACGTAWREDNPDPRPDCSLTPLGQTFVGHDGTWQTSAEYALVRILTTTPANTDVTGTSSERLRDLADFFNIGGGYSQILANVLGIGRTDPVAPTESLVLALQENFLATHPAMEEDSKLKIYLSDALTDLASMTQRLGPAGEHPGIVDPSFTMSGEIFGPNFKMNTAATSNLRLVDGIDGERGKGYVSVIADETGPTYDDALEFDFQNPENFSIEGVVEELTTDMRFRIIEDPQFVSSCVGAPLCLNNAPGAPAVSDSIWMRDPWLLEYTLTAGARHRYLDRRFSETYAVFAHVNVGQDGDPAGWLSYDIPFNFGDPPGDQYLWETVLEVAQVSMHRTQFAEFAEGTVNPAFTLYDVPVGLSGAEATERVRPYLEEQASKLSKLLLGDYKEKNDPVDFYYRSESDGNVYLFFIDPLDLPASAPYTFARPGFYEDPELRTKLSSRTLEGVGDAVHEKVLVPPGKSVVYYEDEDGTTYRLELRRPDDGTTVQVAISERVE